MQNLFESLQKLELLNVKLSDALCRKNNIFSSKSYRSQRISHKRSVFVFGLLTHLFPMHPFSTPPPLKTESLTVF